METTATVIPERAGKREWLGLCILTLPVLLLALDMSVLHLAAPQLSADLQPSSTQLLWILDIYGFLIAGFLITMGTLGDRIGRRRLLMIGAVSFGIASVIAAYSQTSEMLIASRALLGIAGATLMPSTLALISNMFRDSKQRSFGIAVWMAAFTGGTAAGPVVGGIMLENFWWGSVFLLGVPVMLVLLVLGPLALPEFKDSSAGRLDITSVVLSLAAMLPIIYGLKEFAKSGLTLPVGASVVVGSIAGFGFIRRQRLLRDPLLNVRLFAYPGFKSTLILMLLTLTLVSGVIMAFVQTTQMVHEYSALQTALWMLIPLTVNIAASMIVPKMAQRLRPALLIAPGLLVTAIGLAIIGLAPSDSGMGPLMVGVTLVFGGTVPMVVLGTNLVVSSAPKNQAGSASSLSETAGELGAALGVALFGSAITAVYVRHMSGLELASDIPTSVTDNLAAAVSAARELVPELIHTYLPQAQAAFVQGVQTGAIVGAVAMALLAAVALVTLRRVPPIGHSDEVTGAEFNADVRTDELHDDRSDSECGSEPECVGITSR